MASVQNEKKMRAESTMTIDLLQRYYAVHDFGVSRMSLHTDETCIDQQAATI